MSDLFWLAPAQLKRIKPHFPLSHGVPRVDDLRVISGIIRVIRNGLRWRDAPKDYGPHKTLGVEVAKSLERFYFGYDVHPKKSPYGPSADPFDRALCCG